jgi:hypothetical protein
MANEFDQLLQSSAPAPSEFDQLFAVPAQSPIENAGALAAPINGGDRIPQRPPTEGESDRIALDDENISPEFASDFRIVTGGLNPASIGAKTPRQALDLAVSSGRLDPSFMAGQDFGAFGSQWEPYKQQMRSNMLGAAGRGAVSTLGSTAAALPGASLGSTVGAVGGGALGSLLGPAGTAAGAMIGSNVGGIGGAMVGGLIGDLIQTGATDLFGLKSEQDKAQDRFDQERAQTRWARMFGEVVPSLTSYKGIGIGTEKLIGKEVASKVLAGEAKTIGGLVAGGAIGGVIPAAIESLKGEPIDQERVAFGVLSGALLQPSQLGQRLFDRQARNAIAASNAVTSIIGARVTNPAEAIANLKLAPNINVGGVQAGAGDISADIGLMGLANALRKRDTTNSLIQRDVQSLGKVATNIGAALEPVGASPQVARQNLAAIHQGMDDAAVVAFNNAVNKGDADAAAMLHHAMEASAQAQQMAQSGLTSAETAVAAANKNYQSTLDQIELLKYGRKDPSEIVYNSLLNNDELHKTVVSDLYKVPAAQGVLTDFTNTYAAAKAFKSSKYAGETGEVPSVIQKILDARKPRFDAENNPLHVRPVEALESDLRNINDAIADQKTGTGLRRSLNSVKDAIYRDLEEAGKHEVIATANAANKVYSDIFVNGSIGDILRRTRSNPLYVPEVIKIGMQNPMTLKEAIGSDPAATIAIEKWIANEFAQSMGIKPSAEKARKWMNQDVQKEWFLAFPGAKPIVENAAKTLANAVALQEQAAATKTTASAAVAEASKGILKWEASANASAEEVRRIQEATLNQTKESIAKHVATRFINSDPEIAIENILKNSNDPLKDMQDLLSRAKTDPSGQATEGVKNALRQYLSTATKQTGVQINPSNIIKPPSMADQKASFAKITDLMRDGSATRDAIIHALGWSSDEVKALDLGRTQMQVLEGRRRYATAGGSDTSFNTEMNLQLAEQLADSSLSVLHRIARGKSVESAVARGGGGFWAGVMDLMHKAWAGDTQAQAMKILLDAETNPALMASLLQNPKQNLPEVRTWLKNYGIPYAFAPETSKQDTLGQGGTITDEQSGYRVVTKDNKKFQLFSPAGKMLGIYDNANSANTAASKDMLKRKPLK